MLDFFTKEVGNVIGTTTGLFLGVPMVIAAATLDISVNMLEEAIDAGCETYEEVKVFFDLD